MMPLWLEILMSIALFLMAFVLVLMISQGRKREARLDDAEKSIVMLQTQISPFWATLQTKFVDALHQPEDSHGVMDDLLEKLEGLTITPAEQAKLEVNLKEIQKNGPTDAAEKAGVLLQVMPMVLKEAAGEIPESDERTIAAKKLGPAEAHAG